MLIWLGVTGTILALIGVGVIGSVVWAVVRLERRAEFLDDAQDNFLEAQNKRMEREDAWLREFSAVFADGGKKLRADAERVVADWKSAATAFAKSEQELADNLAALLREVKVSKAFATGSIALVENNVIAVEKLLKLVEYIRMGPRTPTNVAPTDEQIAAAEKGESPDQQLAIESMLKAARERAMEPEPTPY